MPRVTPDPDLPDRLADLVLPAADGTDVRLGALWAQQPRVLVHLRHFGCLFCREHVIQLRERADRIRALGADLAAIGTGDRSYAADFRDAQGIDFPLLVDEALASYGAAGAQRGSLRTFLRPRQWVDGARALLSGVGNGRPGKQPFMLGATHVLTPQGRVPFAWINEDFGDNAPIDAVVATLEEEQRGHTAA